MNRVNTFFGEKITLREINSQDSTFLYQVYASTRQEELAVVDWDDSQKEVFLKMQFDAQHKYYLETFTEAGFHILVFDGEEVGRLYLEQRDDEIRIIDIALLPEFRNQGIGTECMETILELGHSMGKPVRIHVECNNPAMSLYLRLGFQRVSENGIYVLMEKMPKDLQRANYA
jgi:ribosomal protein S18 acetylase RimI-like enzyme